MDFDEETIARTSGFSPADRRLQLGLTCTGYRQMDFDEETIARTSGFSPRTGGCNWG